MKIMPFIVSLENICAYICMYMSPYTVHPQCIYIELLEWDLEWLCTNAKLADGEVGQPSGIIFKNIVNMIQIEK